MCRNHSHVTALRTGTVVLTPHGWMEAHRVVQDLTIQGPTGENTIYPPGTIFYVPSRHMGDYAPPDTQATEEPTGSLPFWEDEEPTYTATIMPSARTQHPH